MTALSLLTSLVAVSLLAGAVLLVLCGAWLRTGSERTLSAGPGGWLAGLGAATLLGGVLAFAILGATPPEPGVVGSRPEPVVAVPGVLVVVAFLVVLAGVGYLRRKEDAPS